MTRRARALALAVAAAVAGGCHRRAASPPAPPDDETWVERSRVERGEVVVVEARREVVAQTVAAAGRVAFDDQRVQHVLSPVAGQVSRLLAEPGQRVRRGSPLLALLSPDVASAMADVAKAQADAAQADAELARQRRLVAVEAASRRDLEAAEDAQGKASAELARARQKAALLRSSGDVDAVTQEYTLRSAIEGVVLARAATPGMQVQGSYAGGAPVELFTVGDIDRVWILADVPEVDVARVRPGASAVVRVAAWPGRTFDGRVDWIAGALDPALRTARVRVALANADHALKPEMLAQVTIAASTSPATVLPAAAIVAIEGSAFASVEAGDAPGGKLRFRRTRVHVADGAGDRVVVQDGVTPGERVLVDAAARPATEADEVRLPAAQVERAALRVEPVREQDVADTLTAGARLTFDDARVAHVFSPVTGRVVRVLADPGQRVRRGTPLLAIVSPEVGAAFADAVKARAGLVAAEHERTRQRELFEAHAGARKDLEAAEAAWQKARAEVARAGEKTRLLAGGDWDAVTQQYTVRSPIAGEVVARAAAPGLEVQGQWSGGGSPVELFTIGALDPLWVLGDVYEMDLPHVRPGLPVEVRVPSLPGRVITGRIAWVSEVVDPATRTARIRCAIDNPERLLRPEMAPVLSIALPSHRHLGVPREAVLRLGDETVVFVDAGSAPDGQRAFRRRKVVVGDEAASGVVPVLGGLAAGDRVVVAGGIFLVGLL